MATIDDLRKEIDEIDDQLMNLLEKRFDLTYQIGIEKNKIKRTILDTKREEIIINKISKYSHSPQIESVYMTVMAESKKAQRK